MISQLSHAEDLMLEFVDGLKTKRPDLQDILDGVYEAHMLTEFPN